MKGDEAQIAGSTAARDAASDWQAMRGDADIQYAPIPPAKPPEPPAWMKALEEWLEGLLEPLGGSFAQAWPVIQNVLIAIGILLVLYILWRILSPLLHVRRKPKAEADLEWAPDRIAAVALLEDADRLAAEGRYGEAAHLLLLRSVSHIAEARPGWLVPASTAREIGSYPLLPEAARHAFAAIAVRVERSLFALRELDAADWTAARAAYADFALHKFAAEQTA